MARDDDIGDRRYVPIRDVARVTGRSERDIRRKMNRGEFPPGTKHGRKRMWRLDLVYEWLSKQDAMMRQELAAAAVDDPEQLTDEQVHDTAFELAARHLTSTLGREVKTGDIEISYARTDAERQEHGAGLLKAVLGRFGSIRLVEALLLQAAFLKPLRDDALLQLYFDHGVDFRGGSNIDDDIWHLIGITIMSWPEGEEAACAKKMAPSMHDLLEAVGVFEAIAAEDNGGPIPAAAE